MEKSVESIKRGYSSVTLAYLGDAFYETLVREHIVGDGDCRVAALNEDAKRFVTAAAQSRIIEALLPDLTEEEELFYKYGRNAHANNHSKSASAVEYRRATGLECLFGYLYLAGRTARARELFAKAVSISEETK